MSVEILYIVIPAYNESENMEQLIDDWYPVIEKHNGNGLSRLVIIDDGSRDNTYEILTEFAKTRPLLLPLTKENSGHGSTLIFGYKYAIKNNADWVFQTDSDGQTDSAEFEEFWNHRNEYDIIIGNRTNRQDGISRIFVQKMLLLILKNIFKTEMPDSNAPFRLIKKEILEKHINKIPADFNLPNVMISTYSVYYHEKVCFLKISFKQRSAGRNSINKLDLIKTGVKALKDFKRIKKDMY